MMRFLIEIIENKRMQANAKSKLFCIRYLFFGAKMPQAALITNQIAWFLIGLPNSEPQTTHSHIRHLPKLPPTT
jgi:hypothetical protein